MNILVTGKNGQLGSEIAYLAKKSKHTFHFVDKEDGDIRDKTLLDDLITRHKIDAIINCAAYTAVDRAESEPGLATQINSEGTSNLVALCEQHDLKLLHISTDYVFSGDGSTPYKPKDPVSPLGVYGKTKRAGEEHILNSTVSGIIIRTSWVFSSFGSNFVKTMLRLGQERSELKVVNDQKGCPTYARDLAQTCITLVDKDWSKAQRVYHFSNSGATTWFEFAKEIMRLAGLNCDIHPIPTSEFPTPAKRPSYSVLDSSEITKDFGIVPRNWHEALYECTQAIHAKT
jgi:dTDP-4-dehydrorhamnose reductase